MELETDKGCENHLESGKMELEHIIPPCRFLYITLFPGDIPNVFLIFKEHSIPHGKDRWLATPMGIGLSWPFTKPPFGACAIYFHYGET